MLISNAVEVLWCCDRCVEQVETGVAEIGSCKFVCEKCMIDHQLCERCKALNLSSDKWKSMTTPHPPLPPTSDWQEHRPWAWQLLANKEWRSFLTKIMIDHQLCERCKALNLWSDEWKCMTTPQPPHQTDKNIVAEHNIYWQIKNREAFWQKSFKSCVRILMLLSTNRKDAITQEALSWIDRMSNHS